MNNITKQVITELETIKAIASELADMSPRTQMEIVALCKEICLNVDKVLEKHDIDITTLFEYVQTIESELEEIRQLIDPQHLALIDERLEDIEASILTINESIGGINETLSTHTTQIQGLQNNKQDTLTAGENITIENNVISASGGSVELYEHRIVWEKIVSPYTKIYATLYSTQPTAMSAFEFFKEIYARGNFYQVSGGITTSGTTTYPVAYISTDDAENPQNVIVGYAEGSGTISTRTISSIYSYSSTNYTVKITKII